MLRMLALCATFFISFISLSQIRADEKTAVTDWLKKFVGEWDSEGEGVMGPGQPTVKCKGTAKVKPLGSNWVVADQTNEVTGIKITAMMQLGYDPEKKKIVGTWVDSMQSNLWVYTGKIDATGKILTLEAEGPSLTDPKVVSKYQDIYEIKSDDDIVLTSQVQSSDGKWMKFMSGNLKRVKK
jgi:hypothetical protein